MAEIKQAKFIDQTGQEKDAVFVGAEKAIYDDSGKRLDQKLEEREKATGLLASDTQGILGNIGAEVSLQSIIDKVAEKIMRELVSNSSLTQTLANYMTTAMMSGEQIDDGNKVPTSALAFAMNQAITQNKNAITQLNSELEIKHVNVPIDETYVTREPATQVTYYKFGKIILLYFYDIRLKPGFSTENVATIASGLPVPSPGMIPTAVAHAHDTVIRVSVAHDGKLKPWYVGNTTDTVFSGQIIYTIQ